MYRSLEGALVLSPSDLVASLECAHLTDLERQVAAGLLVRPEQHDPELDVLRRRGDEHERAELERLRSEGRVVVEVDLPHSGPAELAAAEAATLAAMRSGADVIYQATFFDGRWRGHADFLLRVDTPTDLGPWGYEVADTKLARRAKPAALLQLCAYAEQVARLQGAWPEYVEVVTGTGERSRHRVAEMVAWYRAVKARFEALLDAPPAATYPEPVDHCRVCPWRPRCEAQWRSDDHLSLVAGARRDVRERLVAAGLGTVAALAASEVGAEVPRVGLVVADRLRSQARLQVQGRAEGRLLAELLEPDGEGRGLAALPAPSPGDVFFDLEGDPWAEGGIEYLWGLVELHDGRTAYRAWWAHTPEEEKAAFEAVVDHLIAGLDDDPGMHVYHYAPYETAVLKRLMGRHGTKGPEVDRLLRAEVFVDLYRVVRQGVRVSTEGYGLKALEPLYLSARSGAVGDGASSIVAYEEWLETGDQALLDDLRAYNQLDCESTHRLRDWLEDRRAELERALGEPLSRPGAQSGAPSEAQEEADVATAALAARLLHGVPDDPAEREADQQGRWLLAALLDWHRREAKPAWWAWFDRLARSDADLVNDTDSLGELEHVGEVGEVERSVVHRYRYDPSQEHKVGVGATLVDPRTERSAGDVVAVDLAAGTIDLQRSRTSRAPHPTSLVPARPYGDTDHRAAIAAIATWVAENHVDGPGPYRAVRDLLVGVPPAVRCGERGEPLRRPDETAEEAALRLVHQLDGAVLAVQGPPGSGKTRTGARLVLDLVRAGKRVGIAAFSHKAIANLLEALAAQAEADGVAPRIVQKADAHQRCGARNVECTGNATLVEAALAAGEVDVVAGTTWLFARRGMREAVDVLVVDEAGQLSLANVLAMSTAATDLVLLGDPQQLAQPARGVHPPGAEASALEHVLAGASTMPAERGLFLDSTHRMHPEVCAFVSELAYDGRLEAAPATKLQEVGAGPLLSGAGLRIAGVRHEGNRTRSHEEAEVVARLVAALDGRPFVGREGQLGWLSLDEILVIAPYNAQVAALADALPVGARVGTVDRFQGQEAPVVIYSMGASSADDAPRGVPFLYSRNRLNVAVSRARALAVVVASPDLLAARCRTPEQVALVNGLCRFAELADLVEV